MGLFDRLFGFGTKARNEFFVPPAPPSDEEIARTEAALGVKLPQSFVSFMRESRKMKLPPYARFHWAGDIAAANRQEHEEAGSPLPHFLITFYNDGMGNQACFDTRHAREDGEYPIVFWDHELGPEENLAVVGKPSSHRELAGLVASSFSEWLHAVYEEAG